jgi:hypothetical protein
MPSSAWKSPLRGAIVRILAKPAADLLTSRCLSLLLVRFADPASLWAAMTAEHFDVLIVGAALCVATNGRPTQECSSTAD